MKSESYLLVARAYLLAKSLTAYGLAKKAGLKHVTYLSAYQADRFSMCRILPRSSRAAKITVTNQTTRGLIILVARLADRNINRIFSFCHYFAIMKRASENESPHLGQNEMVGLKGKSRPPGNMNAFNHGLAFIEKRREEGVPTQHEENIRQQIHYRTRGKHPKYAPQVKPATRLESIQERAG